MNLNPSPALLPRAAESRDLGLTTAAEAVTNMQKKLLEALCDKTYT